MGIDANKQLHDALRTPHYKPTFQTKSTTNLRTQQQLCHFNITDVLYFKRATIQRESYETQFTGTYYMAASVFFLRETHTANNDNKNEWRKRNVKTTERLTAGWPRQ